MGLCLPSHGSDQDTSASSAVFLHWPKQAYSQPHPAAQRWLARSLGPLGVLLSFCCSCSAYPLLLLLLSCSFGTLVEWFANNTVDKPDYNIGK